MRESSGLGGGRVLIAVLGLVIVAMASVAGGYFTRSHTSAGVAPATRDGGPVIVRGVVQAVAPGSITLLTEAGPVILSVTPSTQQEAVQAATLADVRPGDWVSAGAVPHAQTLYALTALVVIPASNLEAGR